MDKLDERFPESIPVDMRELLLAALEFQYIYFKECYHDDRKLPASMIESRYRLAWAVECIRDLSDAERREVSELFMQGLQVDERMQEVAAIQLESFVEEIRDIDEWTVAAEDQEEEQGQGR